MKKAKKLPAKNSKQVRTKKDSAKQSLLPSISLRWLKARRKWQQVLLIIAFALLSVAVLNAAVERLIPQVQNPNYGVSFSVKYARELGVDWKANYTALLDDLKFRNFRLMSYWNEVEAERGVYNFNDLDWQMNEAAKRGAKVSLAIGMRQPRWPECHKPNWLQPLSKEQRDQALFSFNRVVIERYKNHPALASYQMENEAVNSWFGTCTPEDIDQKRLETEFEQAKKVDPSHPIYMSLSDQHGLPLGKPVPDKYGFSVYRVVWNDKTGPFKFYVTYPTPAWYHRLRAWWIRTFKHREIFVHELQIEPWGPKATVNLTVEEQNRSMDPAQIKENITFARKVGVQDIYVWGGEWWYWRKTTLRDPSIWETVRSEVTKR